jgi:hypothetical protein
MEKVFGEPGAMPAAPSAYRSCSGRAVEIDAIVAVKAG